MPADGETISAASIAFEVIKIGLAGVAGYGAKIFIDQKKSTVKDIRKSLSLLSELSRDAEKTMRSIIGGNADHMLSYSVLTDRTTLRHAILEAFGSRQDFSKIDLSYTAFSSKLAHADPHFGGTTQTHIDEMRQAETQLRQTLERAADENWVWRYLRHDKDA